MDKFNKHRRDFYSPESKYETNSYDLRNSKINFHRKCTSSVIDKHSTENNSKPKLKR